eukprot:sb/3467014/
MPVTIVTKSVAMTTVLLTLKGAKRTTRRSRSPGRSRGGVISLPKCPLYRFQPMAIPLILGRGHFGNEITPPRERPGDFVTKGTFRTSITDSKTHTSTTACIRPIVTLDLPSLIDSNLSTETSKQPIRTRYQGHVTGYQPVSDHNPFALARGYFVTKLLLTYTQLEHMSGLGGQWSDHGSTVQSTTQQYITFHIIYSSISLSLGSKQINRESSSALHFNTHTRPGTDRNKLTTNQNSLFRSRDWLSANQGPVFPDSVGSCTRHTLTKDKTTTKVQRTDRNTLTGYQPIRDQYFLIRSVPVPDSHKAICCSHTVL